MVPPLLSSLSGRPGFRIITLNINVIFRCTRRVTSFGGFVRGFIKKENFEKREFQRIPRISKNKLWRARSRLQEKDTFKKKSYAFSHSPKQKLFVQKCESHPQHVGQISPNLIHMGQILSNCWTSFVTRLTHLTNL